MADRTEEETQMRYGVRAFLVMVTVVALAAGCTAMTGKTAGQNVDDAAITAQVKAKLAAEKAVTLTKVDVDTNQGTVYLTGNVESAAMKARAAELARQVAGVREVVNNLKVP
jgi:hyperosmotically inducible periplasmic protein